MKQIKINKRLLKKMPAEILGFLGAVHGNRAFPEHVYLSKKDYNLLEKNLINRARRERPGMAKKFYRLSVGFELLNLGPSQLVENAVKDGYAIVDSEAIAAEIAKLDQEPSVGSVQ